MSPGATRHQLIKQKSLRTEKKPEAGEMPPGAEQNKITRARNPSATQPIHRKSSAIRQEGAILNQTVPFTQRITKEVPTTQGTKITKVRDDSGDRSQEHDRKNSSNQRQNKHDTWVEEQKANFELTYLRPLKLKNDRKELTAKPQAKTIKSGRLVKLPIVQRNKQDHILAKAGFDSLQMHENKPGYSTLMQGKIVE